MLTCYIIDDEQYSIDCLVVEIERMPGLSLIGYNTDPLTALNEIRGGKMANIIFLDVEMPALSGLELARLLPSSAALIMRSSYSKFASGAFDVNAVDFLCKPYNFDRFLKAVLKAQHFLVGSPISQAGDLKSVWVSSLTKGKVYQIATAEIIYIEALDHIISIHTLDQVIPTRMNLKEIEKMLPSISFARVHRGFIVNIDHIKFFDGSGITMPDKVIVPFGESFRQAFKDRMHFRSIPKS